MFGYNTCKFGYMDSDGNFIALDSPITSSDFGSKVTVDSVATVSAFDNSSQDYCCSKKYTDQRVENIENMFTNRSITFIE